MKLKFVYTLGMDGQDDSNDTWNSTTSPFNFFILKGNDLHDPVLGSVNIKPVLFDEMMTVYKNCKVIKSHLRLVCNQPSSAGNQWVMVTRATDIPPILWRNQQAAHPNPRLASRDSKARQFFGSSAVSDPNGGRGRSHGTIKMTADTKKLFRVRNLDDFDFVGTATTSPTNLTYFLIQVQGSPGDIINMQAFITFDVEFDTLFPGQDEQLD